MEKIKEQIQSLENIIASPNFSEKMKETAQETLDELKKQLVDESSSEEVIVDGKQSFVNDIFIGFDKPSSYQPSAWARAKKAMEKAIELGWAEAYDFGKGKGKYTSTKESNATGLTITQIGEQVFDGTSVKEYQDAQKSKSKKPQKPKSETPTAPKPPKLRSIPKGEIILLGSSSTAQGIGELITKYYMGSEITLDPISQSEWDVKNKKGIINGVRVVLKGGRYRFEQIPFDKTPNPFNVTKIATFSEPLSEEEAIALTASEDPIDFLKTIETPPVEEPEKLKATLSFKTRAHAEEFATAYSRRTKRGHTIGSGTEDVTVTVDDLSEEDTRWIDNYASKLNSSDKVDTSRLNPSDVEYKDGKYFVDKKEISASQFKEIQDRAIKASKGQKTAEEKIQAIKKQLPSKQKSRKNADIDSVNKMKEIRDKRKSNSTPKAPTKKSASSKIKSLKTNPKLKGMLEGLTDEEIDRDLKRKAKPMGKRKSKDGNIYYENRRTKSDVNPRRKI